MGTLSIVLERLFNSLLEGGTGMMIEYSYQYICFKAERSELVREEWQTFFKEQRDALKEHGLSKQAVDMLVCGLVNNREFVRQCAPEVEFALVKRAWELIQSERREPK